MRKTCGGIGTAPTLPQCLSPRWQSSPGRYGEAGPYLSGLLCDRRELKALLKRLGLVRSADHSHRNLTRKESNDLGLAISVRAVRGATRRL